MMDTLTVKVEVREDLFSDEVRKLQALEKRIARTIKEYFGVTAQVMLVEPKSLSRSEGKAVRVVDNRKI